MPSPLPGLRRAREAAGLTQQQLADAAELRVMTISDIERGAQQDVRISVVRRLAEALGVRMSELLGDE